jgi:hypothetical protein
MYVTTGNGARREIGCRATVVTAAVQLLSFAIAAAPMLAPGPAQCQTNLGPTELGPLLGQTSIFGPGTTTVVGSTTISGPDALSLENGATLVTDPTAGPMPGPITLTGAL